MSSVIKSDLVLRREFINSKLQTISTEKKLLKFGTIESIVFFILKTFGRCYLEALLAKLNCKELKAKVKDDRKTVGSIYSYLKDNKFNQFVQLMADNKSILTATTVEKIGNDYFGWTKFLPWPVQQLRAIPNIEERWKGMDVRKFISTIQKEEESAEEKLRSVFEKKVLPEDVFTLEEHLLSPVSIKKYKAFDEKLKKERWVEKVISQFSLLLSWSMVYKPDLEKAVLPQFPLLNVVNDNTCEHITYLSYLEDKAVLITSTKIVLSTPAIPIPQDNTFKPDHKELVEKSEKEKEEQSQINPAAITVVKSPFSALIRSPVVSFSDFRISYVIQCICANLGVKSFTDGTVFSRRFYNEITQILAQNLESLKDAVYFSANLDDIPNNTSVKSFLEACKQFIEFRKNVATSSDISFILEWIYFANMKDRDFTGYNVTSLKGREEWLHKLVKDLKISHENQFFVLLSLLNLKSVSEFVSFLKTIQRDRFFLLDQHFIVEFFRQKINPLHYNEMIFHFGNVHTSVGLYIDSIYLNSSLWLEICSYIEKKPKMFQEIFNDFSIDVLKKYIVDRSNIKPLEVKEKMTSAEGVQQKKEMEALEKDLKSDLEDIFITYFKYPLLRLYVKKINGFLDVLANLGTPFSITDRCKLLHQMRLLKIIQNENVNANMNNLGSDCAIVEQILKANDEVLKGLTAICQGFKFTSAQITAIYIDYTTMPGDYLRRHLDNILQIRNFLNIQFRPIEIFYWLKHNPNPDGITPLIKKFQSYREMVIKEIRAKKVNYTTIDPHWLKAIQADKAAFREMKSMAPYVYRDITGIMSEIGNMIGSNIAFSDFSLLSDCFKSDFLVSNGKGNKSFLFFNTDYPTGKAVYRRWHIPKSAIEFPVLEISLINMTTQDMFTFLEPFPLVFSKFNDQILAGTLHQFATGTVDELMKLNGCQTSLNKIKKFFEIAMLSLSLPESEIKVRTELLTESGLIVKIQKLQHSEAEIKEYDTLILQVKALLKGNQFPQEKKFLAPVAFTCKVQLHKLKDPLVQNPCVKELTFEANQVEYSVCYSEEDQKQPNFDTVLLWQFMAFTSRCKNL